MHRRAIATAALAAVLTGCAPTPTTAASVVSVGPVLEFRVDVARTPDELREGLAGRAEMSEGTGMLFVFDQRSEREVWMAGMQVALDVAWIVDDQVLSVDTLDPCTDTNTTDCPRWTSPGEVDALLEVPAGSLDGIEPGTPVNVRKERQ